MPVKKATSAAPAASRTRAPQTTAKAAGKSTLTRESRRASKTVVQQPAQPLQPGKKELLRVSWDERNDPPFVLVSGGRFVSKDLQAKLTDDLSEAAQEDYVSAGRLMTAFNKNLYPSVLAEPLHMEQLVVSRYGLVLGTTKDFRSDEPVASWKALDDYDLALAQIAADEPAEDEANYFNLSHMLSYSPLWPLFAAECQAQLEAERLEPGDRFKGESLLWITGRLLAMGIFIGRRQSQREADKKAVDEAMAAAVAKGGAR